MEKYRIEIKWALIFCAVTLLWMLLEKLCGLHGRYIDYHLYLTNLFAIPAILIFVFALIDKKKNYYGGSMSFRQGLIAGVIMSVIIALLSPVTQWITSYVISPEYFPNIIRRSVELGYYKTTEAAAAEFNYMNYALHGVAGALLMGIITTLIIMFFLRTKSQTATI